MWDNYKDAFNAIHVMFLYVSLQHPNTYFFKALFDQNLKIVQLFLTHGADINFSIQVERTVPVKSYHLALWSYTNIICI